MSTVDPDRLLRHRNDGVLAARAAGELLKRRPERVHHKGAIDLVTEIDLASERTIREVLGRLDPAVPVQGEEGGGQEGGLRWVVDPLDGTTNFVHGFPFYCVSIGLCDGPRPLVGVIYDPVRDQCFSGALGGGATVQVGAAPPTPLAVSNTRVLSDALVITGFPYDRVKNSVFYLSYVQRVLEGTQGVRRSGSAAMDMTCVANGSADAFWEFGLHAWDTAAGAVLVAEAGGEITRLDGSAWAPEIPELLVSNRWLHEAFVRLFEDLPRQ